MLLMFEHRIRGGIAQTVHCYASANNPYMEGLYDPEKKSSFLQYQDTNNLYGWAMSQSFPTGRFRWISIQPNDISRLTKVKYIDYLLEVDVKYPEELHDLHNDLPFMCERMKINGVEKLVPNLKDKKNYVIHI